MNLGIALYPYGKELKEQALLFCSPKVLVAVILSVLGVGMVFFAYLSSSEPGTLVSLLQEESAKSAYRAMVFKTKLSMTIETLVATFFLLFFFCISLASFTLSKAFGEFVYWLFVTESGYDLRLRRRVEKRLKAVMKWRIHVSIVILPIITICYMMYAKFYTKDLEGALHSFLFGVFFCVVAVYVHHWIEFLILYKKETIRGLDKYLFSKKAIQRKMKPTFDMLIFFALLGWVLLPLCIVTMDGICQALGKFLTVALSMDETISVIETTGKYPDIVKLLRNMMAVLGTFANLDSFRVADFDEYLHLVQATFFAIIVFIQFFMVAMPVGTIFLLRRDDRVFFKHVLKSTLKTVVILAVAQWFISEFYFVDTSTVLGNATVFLFFLSYFTAHDLPEGLLLNKTG